MITLHMIFLQNELGWINSHYTIANKFPPFLAFLLESSSADQTVTAFTYPVFSGFAKYRTKPVSLERSS